MKPTKSLKILILSDDFPPQSFGGAGFSAFGLAKGLQKAGHDVFAITTCRERAGEGETDYQGLKIFKIFANYHERWRAYKSLYNTQTVGKVRKLIREINPDIVHANNIHYYLSYHCLKVAKNLGKPVFLTARDTMLFSYGKIFNTKISWFNNLKQAKKRYNPFRNIIIKHYLRYVDKIFAISNSLKDALNQNGIQNVEVMHNAIDAGEWQIDFEAVESFKKKYGLCGKKIIFFAGRVSELKGLGQINQAMEKIKEKITQAFLLMAGREGIGWLREEDLKAAYAAADIIVVPSIYLDPFNRTNIEAMACKKPVVGTCYGGTPEIVKDGVTGYIVNPFDTNLMAEKIIDLLRNSEKAKQFGEAGYQRVKEHFNLDDHIAQAVYLYNKYANIQ